MAFSLPFLYIYKNILRSQVNGAVYSLMYHLQLILIPKNTLGAYCIQAYFMPLIIARHWLL